MKISFHQIQRFDESLLYAQFLINHASVTILSVTVLFPPSDVPGLRSFSSPYNHQQNHSV